MFKWRSLVDARREELARALVSEHGKVISDARGEVQRGLEVIDFACAAGELLKGDFSENVSTAVDSYSYKQPLGVVVSITPFNFPAMCVAVSWMGMRGWTNAYWGSLFYLSLSLSLSWWRRNHDIGCRCGRCRWRWRAATLLCSSRLRRTPRAV